jgi:hypothetical protein
MDRGIMIHNKGERMRGFLVLLSVTLLTALVANAEDTFVEKCLAGTKVLDAKLVCVATTNGDGSGDTYVLDRGQQLYVNGKHLAVKRITHLPARLSDMGPLPESVRFSAQSSLGLTKATVTVSCDGQVQAALTSVQRWPASAQPEVVADCQVQSN